MSALPASRPDPAEPDALPRLLRGRWAVLAVAAGPAGLAVAGLTHPPILTAETAPHWAMLHTVLIPVFPLVGLSLAVLVAGRPGALPWVVRVAGYVYAVFYSAVDLLAGVGASQLVLIGQVPPAATVDILFARANALGDVGVYALWLGCALAVVLLLPAGRVRVLVGAVPLLAGAYLFGENHIYRPWGVLGMVLLAGGFALLLRGRQVASR